METMESNSVLTDTELMMYMITRDEIVKKSIAVYRELFADSSIELEACEKICNSQGYLERFLMDSVTCMLITGFVVFRFFEVKEKGEKKLVPLVVPISEIQWVFEKDDINYEFDVRVPEVFVQSAGINNSTRFYVYRFDSNRGISSAELGVVFSLVSPFRSYLDVQEYNRVLMAENLRTTVFIEHKVATDSRVESGSGKHQVSSAPLINRILEQTNFRATTHSEVPPTPTEEIRKSIEEQIECSDKMEIVILPPNTAPNVIRNSHTLMDTTMNRQDFQRKVHEIMSIPSKTQNTVRSSASQHNRQSENNNVQRMIEIANKKAKFTKEAEKLITIICVFCNCKNVENKIQKYYKKNILKGQRMKRQRQTVSLLQNSYAIPIQLLGLKARAEQCTISTSSAVSSMFFSSVLYEESMVPPHNLLELVMKSVDMKQLSVDKVDK